MNKSKFLGYSIGLMRAREDNRKPIRKLVKIEYSKCSDGNIILQAVSGNNLARLKGTAVVNAEDWASRPYDTYDDTVEAQWAMSLCGWESPADLETLYD